MCELQDILLENQTIRSKAQLVYEPKFNVIFFFFQETEHIKYLFNVVFVCVLFSFPSTKKIECSQIKGAKLWLRISYDVVVFFYRKRKNNKKRPLN